MTWWQTLLVASVPALFTALVTAGALIYQQHRTDVREHARMKSEAAQRADDRQAADRTAAEKRRQDLADVWREQRRQAYIESISMFHRLRRRVEDMYAATYQFRPDADMPDNDDGWQAIEDDTERRAILSTVELIGSPGAVLRLRTLVEDLDSALFSISASLKVEEFRAERVRVENSLIDYTTFVRTDLDVDHLN